MASGILTAPSNPRRKAHPWLRQSFNRHTLRGAVTLVVFVILWALVVAFKVPYLRLLPPPRDVAVSLLQSVASAGYWANWWISMVHIAVGFVAAVVVGVPLGLAMGINRTVRRFVFPIFEVLRPVPPIAWIPLAIIFWPTVSLTIYFLVFTGPFFIIVLNVMDGVREVSQNHVRAALSLGAKPRDVFWRIMLPATLPYVMTGMAVGMGVTWNVLIAAEMVTSATESGLGSMTWTAYTNGILPVIVVGMLSIGVAGYLSSALLRLLGERLMPWQRRI